jgi:AraC-like DNA-binding protein/mannose-6-phosphate isomerase-like protein (cupin superfamily)
MIAGEGMKITEMSARKKSLGDHIFRHFHDDKTPAVNSGEIDFIYQDRSAFQPPLHTHHHYEVLYLHSGSCSYLVGGEIYRLAAGDVLLMNGLTLHRPKAEEGSEYVRSVIHFDHEGIRPFLQTSHSLNVLRPFQEFHHYRLSLCGHDREEVESILAKMSFYFKQQDMVNYNRFRLSLVDLLYFIFTKFENAPAHKGVPSHKEKTVQNIISYLEQNYMHDITLETLQADMHMNKFYLSKLFKEITGTTIFYFLYRHRIKEARKMFMMDQSLSVTEVCYRVGFKHLSHFSRVFKQEVGMSPEAFKKSTANKAVP